MNGFPLLDSVLSTLSSFKNELALFAAASALLFVVSLIAIPWLVTRLPADYFARERARPTGPSAIIYRSLKNLLGIGLLVFGIVMLFLPGQGLLTILVAVMVMDFPGKHALERTLLRRYGLLEAANKLRAWRGRPALYLDPSSHSRKN